MVPFLKRAKIPQKNGTISSRKGSKFLNKNGTSSEKDQKSSTKMVPVQKRIKNPQQKWYHFSQKRVDVCLLFVIIPRQKRNHFRKGSKFLNKNGTISEEGQTSSIKMEPFQKRVKNRQRKWYHFSQKRVKIPKKW